MKISIFGIFLFVNAVAILCALNPWLPDWQRQGITLLVVEIVIMALVGVPAVIYQMVLKKRRSSKACLTRSMR
jgi:hypothetical protein